MNSTVRQHSYCGEQELPVRKECEHRVEAPATLAQTPVAEEHTPEVYENSKAKWEGERGGTDSASSEPCLWQCFERPLYDTAASENSRTIHPSALPRWPLSAPSSVLRSKKAWAVA